MKTIEVYSEQKGWIVVAVERDYDRAFTAAKALETRLKDTPVRVADDGSGKTEWRSR